MAYYLKEELNEIWEQDDQEAAEAVLRDWVEYAQASGSRIPQTQDPRHPRNQVRFSRMSRKFAENETEMCGK